MANSKGVAEIIRDYQMSIEPWDDNEPVDLMECRGCGGPGIRDGMEFARLTAICRKTKCGPLENEIVRLHAQVTALEERKTSDSESEAEEKIESEAEEEMEFASQADADGELARANAELEEQEKKNADLDSKNVDLQSKNNDLEIEILKLESDLARFCKMIEGHYKWLSDQYDQELIENLQQHKQVTELEEEHEKLKDQMAMMAMEGRVAGIGGDLSAEEQAYQQAKQHSSVQFR
jgi:chromosome segregation ATPase